MTLSITGPVAPLLRVAADLDPTDITARPADLDELFLSYYRTDSSPKRWPMSADVAVLDLRLRRRALIGYAVGLGAVRAGHRRAVPVVQERHQPEQVHRERLHRRRPVRRERPDHHPHRLAQRQPVRQLRAPHRPPADHRLRRVLSRRPRRGRHARPGRCTAHCAAAAGDPKARDTGRAGRRDIDRHRAVRDRRPRIRSHREHPRPRSESPSG